MNEPDLSTLKQLKPAQMAWVIIITLVVVLPPTLAMVFDWPPALWLKCQESSLWGGYLPKLTWVLLALTHASILFVGVCLVALPVRWLTGKTIVQLFSGKAPTGVRAALLNVVREAGDIYADVDIRAKWLEEGKAVSVVTPDGRLIQLRLNAGMSPGSQLRMKGQTESRGDLYLRLRVS